MEPAMYVPDYSVLRKETKFSWYVSSTYLALLDATGIKIKDMFLDSDAGIELYRKGCPLIREMFGPDVRLPAPATPPVSYGHINALGAELFFPEGGEVNHGTLGDSLEECIRILKLPVDFANAGMLPFYLEYRRKMEAAFPDEKVSLGYHSEGPLTTAYTLRRDAFFFDPYDEPARTKEFLKLITESIINFNYFLREKIYGCPKINPDGGGLADDICAMLSPDLWPEFVLPYLEQYFQGLTTGKRSAHIEDLRTEQLHFLEKLDLVNYDPSVSPKIDPQIIRENTRVPFQWRLCNFHYPSLTVQDVADFVYKAVEDGASGVFTYVCNGMCNSETVPKVHAFISACRNVERILNSEKASRTDIGTLVSKSGREKFWANWP